MTTIEEKVIQESIDNAKHIQKRLEKIGYGFFKAKKYFTYNSEDREEKIGESVFIYHETEVYWSDIESSGFHTPSKEIEKITGAMKDYIFSSIHLDVGKIKNKKQVVKVSYCFEKRYPNYPKEEED